MLPWDVRLLNGTLRLLEFLRLVKNRIDADNLIREAEVETGLKFSNRSFEEPLRILEKSLNEEAELHPFGRISMRLSIKQILKNRLWLELAWGENPSVLEKPVKRPLYVIGLPRTGTTLLYNLLCQDPNSRALMGWESIMPVAPLSKTRKPVKDYRRDLVHSIERWMNHLAPQLKSVHEFIADGPEECTWLLQSTFVSSSYLLLANLPSYYEYLARLSREQCRDAYTLYAMMLKWLQRDSPAAHWVLKSPVHQSGLGPLLDVIPNACVVQTHRDPVKVIGSCCSMYSLVRRIYSNSVDDHQIGADVLAGLAGVMERAKEGRDEHPDNIFDVHFEEIVQEPLRTVRRIYERFDYPFDPRMESGMLRWLEENPQGKHGTHHYELSHFGLTDEMVRTAFANYLQQFDSLAYK